MWSVLLLLLCHVVFVVMARHHHHHQQQQFYHHSQKQYNREIVSPPPPSLVVGDDNNNNSGGGGGIVGVDDVELLIGDFPKEESVPLTVDRFVVVDAATGIHYNPYSKHHPGRHVCVNQKGSTINNRLPITKAPFKSSQYRCENNLQCSNLRVLYERDVTTKQPKQISHDCCPGWSQITSKSHGCNKPVCSPPCQNGGSCVKPDVCQCCQGYTGALCDVDVNECDSRKPCDHICYNTPGSFKCHCKENFVLMTDGQSCQKEVDDILPLESDGFLQYEQFEKRLVHLENIMNNTASNEEIKQMSYKFSSDIGAIKKKIADMDNYLKNDMHVFRNRLFLIEKKTSKIDDLTARYEKIKKCAFYNKICL